MGLLIFNRIAKGSKMKTALGLVLLLACWSNAQPLDEEVNDALPACVGSEYLTKWTKWSGGLAATIKVSPSESITSWDVHVVLNKDFHKINFYNGKVSVSKGNESHVLNESWSGKKKAGQAIKFSLLGYYKNSSGDEVNVESISLNGKLVCGGMANSRFSRP